MKTTILILVTAIATGLPTTLAAQAQDDVATGAKVYGDMCGRCHNARSPLERTDREWVTIANHMRVRANLTGGQLRAVLAFLQATNSDPSEVAAPSAPTPQHLPSPDQTGPVATDSASVAQGRALMQAKACVGCHVIGSAGGKVGPALNGVVARRGAAFVRQKLADPAFNNATSMMPNFGLTQAEIEAVTAYLATLDR